MGKRRKREKPEVHSVSTTPKRMAGCWFWVPSMLNARGKKIEDSVECWFNSDYYSGEDSVAMTRQV